MLYYFNSIFSWHLEIQKPQDGRSDSYRIYITINLLFYKLISFNNRFFPITTKFTPFNLA